MSKCMQFHLAGLSRWPEHALAQVIEGFTKEDGTHPTVAELQSKIKEMMAEGYEFMPCGCKCLPNGQCTGEPKA